MKNSQPTSEDLDAYVAEAALSAGVKSNQVFSIGRGSDSVIKVTIIEPGRPGFNFKPADFECGGLMCDLT